MKEIWVSIVHKTIKMYNICIFYFFITEKEQVINNEIIDADSDEQERTLCDSPI